MEKLNLDNELLKPIKDDLEKAIDTLTKNAILTGKEAEINLKLNISTLKNTIEIADGKIEEITQPVYEYQISDRIKEAKSSRKSSVGAEYSIELDEEGNVMVKKVNNQTSLFDEEEPDGNYEEDEENEGDNAVLDRPEEDSIEDNPEIEEDEELKENSFEDIDNI